LDSVESGVCPAHETEARGQAARGWGSRALVQASV